MHDAGYDVGDFGELPGVADQDGDALIHALIAAGGQDENWLTESQLAGNPVRISASDYRSWFGTLDPKLRDAVVAHWGPAPGELFVDRSHVADGEIVLAALRAGNVVVMVQPPRGFGVNPVSIYHDPDLPPSHHYLAAYHWLRPRSPPMRSSTSASTATWNGCPARHLGYRRPAPPTPPSAISRSSTRSWSTTPAKAPRPSDGSTPP